MSVRAQLTNDSGEKQKQTTENWRMRVVIDVIMKENPIGVFRRSTFLSILKIPSYYGPFSQNIIRQHEDGSSVTLL